MTEHECNCENCRSALAASLPEATANFGVQWPGHHRRRVLKRVRAETTLMAGPGSPVGDRTWIELDEDVSDTTWQVATGPQGAAWRYSEPKHRCRRCGEGVCAYVDNGNFRVIPKGGSK